MRKTQYYKNKDLAREVIVSNVEKIAQLHGYKYNRIAIRNQRTRLGSCSSKKNLNFNWQIIKFPKKIMEYIIKHELAHLTHQNHSEHYWKEVSRIDPQYRSHHKWIRENAHRYIVV